MDTNKGKLFSAGSLTLRRFPRIIQIYILAVIAGGGIALVAGLPSQIDQAELILLATLGIAGVAAGVRRLPLMGLHGTIDLTGGILLMAVFLTAPSLACLLAGLVTILSGILTRRRVWNVLFNAGAEVLGIGLAGSLYHGLCNPDLLPLDSWTNAQALFISASAYWLVESAVITVLVAARNRDPFLQTYIRNWQEVYVQCILLALLAVLGTAAWRQGMVYACLLLVPAVAVYQMFSITKVKQEQVIKAIEIIAEVLDRRSPFTFQHSQRVAEHVVRLARRVGLTVNDIETLRRAALIHDIGKLGVEDPSKELAPNTALTDYQFYSLKQHAHLGAMIAREIPAFEEAEESIRYHHDWYNGRHISREHAGEGIPLGARILAVADCYDCFCMANGEATLSYDPKAIEQIGELSGNQLDPDLLALFISILEAERVAATR
ncbi:MAG TPA: HD domain-containing phosphohydrolase, partial [Chloroflexota bacterium]|nr:HD domain-containing phosphohydrolase [Chloroflexota bacterium]